MLQKIIRKFKEKGWFEKYPKKHIIYPYLDGNKVLFDEMDSEYIKGIKVMYETFMVNFLRILSYMDYNLDLNSTKWIVRDYLSCEQNYSDQEFLFRYTNVLIMCGLRTFNINVRRSEIKIVDGLTVIRLECENEIVLQLFAGILNRGNIELLLKQNDVLELEVGLKMCDITHLQSRVKEEKLFIAPMQIQQIVDELLKVEKLSAGENVYNICLLHLVSDNIDGYSIYSTKGMFLNRYTGIFVNDLLHDEYHFDVNIAKKVNGVLAFKYCLPFLLYGDIRHIINKEHYFWAVNRNCTKTWKVLFPFVQSECTDKVLGIYNAISPDIMQRYNIYTALMLENYKKAVSSVFSNKEVYLLKRNIERNLLDEPQLLNPFGLDLGVATTEILEKYEWMYTIIRERYPSNHPFRRDEFLFDAMSFSLAYCMYIVPQYLNNSEMINDFLLKKLVCEKDGLFNRKVFNESYSEFEIFFYLFVGIFCNSERYKTFIKLEYEPDGNHNKRFEYAFIFRDYKINVEVKALECAPEDADSISLTRMDNGTRFYKNYFHANNEKDVIPTEILQNAKKLKSNYRQVSKNIKKIKEKCSEEKAVINLGFLMINYGTSREEYISYLMHPEHGYLRKNPLEKLDALVLFSMCINTDLLMRRVLEKEHIFVFHNQQKNNYTLFSDLRLSNYVCEQEDNRYKCFFDEVYGEYVGINSGGIVTIQRSSVPEEEWKQAQNIISETNKYQQELISLSK